jgi:hypothetical protein
MSSDAALRGSLGRLLVFLVDVHAFDNDFVEFGVDLLDHADLAFVIAGENDHLIAFFDVHDYLLITPRWRAR